MGAHQSELKKAYFFFPRSESVGVSHRFSATGRGERPMIGWCRTIIRGSLGRSGKSIKTTNGTEKESDGGVVGPIKSRVLATKLHGLRVSSKG